MRRRAGNNAAPAFLDTLEPSPPPAADKLAAIRFAAERLTELVDRHTKLSETVEELSDEINDISSRQLPDLMSEVGVESVGIGNGVTVKLKPWYRAVLPKDPVEQAAALAWLREHDAGDLVKSTVGVKFSRNEDNLAAEVAGHLEQYLEDHGAGRTVDREVTIHHATYTAYVREQLEAGETLPLAVLGASTGTRAVVETKKQR